jgi:hypothetical protein
LKVRKRTDTINSRDCSKRNSSTNYDQALYLQESWSLRRRRKYSLCNRNRPLGVFLSDTAAADDDDDDDDDDDETNGF